MSKEGPYEEIASPLGHFVMSFNDLEVAAGVAIMNILDLEERVGAVFTAIPSFSQKLQLIHALVFKIERHPYREKFLDLVASAQKLNEHRNRFIHAEYFPARDTEQTIVVAMRRLRDATKPLSGSSKGESFKH